jgi:hypothetical protein
LSVARPFQIVFVLIVATACASGIAPEDEDDRKPRLVVLDPERSYSDRVALLELLRGRHPYPAGMADARDGIVAQSRWQLRSGRAAHAWWSEVNWTLTVWQVQALQQRGELEFVEIVSGTDAPHRAMPPPIAQAIREFYSDLDRVRADVEAGRLTADQKDDAAWRLQQKRRGATRSSRSSRP